MIPAALKLRRQRGTALLETALTMPMVLLVAVGIFEFGRAYQTWQVLTNAAREGARVAVLPGKTETQVRERAKQYMSAGELGHSADATVALTAETIDLGGGATASASRVTVTYPFEFMVLQPIAQLVSGNTDLGAPFNMTASTVMRNE
jgi:Flp pilus assembly protein TadG